jgi:hypothetical protein
MRMMGRTRTMMRSCTRSFLVWGIWEKARSEKYYVQLAETVLHVGSSKSSF